MEHAVSLIRLIFYSRSAIVCVSFGIEIPNPVHRALAPSRTSGARAAQPSYLGTFVVGNFQIRFDLINFFAMFCMECGTKLQALQQRQTQALSRLDSI